MFIIPGKIVSGSVIARTFVVDGSDGTPDKWGFEGFELPNSTTATNIGDVTISMPTTIDSYTPKNNKVLCSPYSYLMVSNNAGTNVCYAWELFSDTPTFECLGAVSQGCDIKLFPKNYRFANTATANYDFAVSCNKFPMLSWNSDYYLNWVAVNGNYQEVSLELSGLEFGLGLVGSMLTGDFSGSGFGEAVGLGKNVANVLQQNREAKMTPDSAKGNLVGGDLTFALERTTFTLHKVTIRAEYAKMIDDYFTCYGYKVNSLKNPNITGRRYWNYVKTVGCNVTANAPQEDIEEIRGLFDRGITIWHDPTKFLDYTQNNTIVT